MAKDLDLSIIGKSRDFIDEESNFGPDWEHIILLRNQNTVKVTIDDLASPSWIPGRHYIDLGLLFKLAGKIKYSRASLAQSEPSGYQTMLAQVATRRTRPLFIIFHGHGWWSRRNRFFAGIARRLPWVHFLCLSEALRGIIVDNYKIPASRVHVTGYGVDSRFFSPVDGATQRYIVSAGAASRDYQTLVQASRTMDIKLCIAADSNWYQEALNVEAGEMPSNIQIASSGDYRGLRTLYEEALFVVVPLRDVSYACGYAVIAEAMAMGKAVIATRTGCPSDLIADGVSGFYVPPNDPETLRAVMQRLIDDPALAQRMGREGRRLVEEQFNLEAYVSRLRSLALAG